MHKQLTLVEKLLHIHWFLVLLVILLACSGFAMLYSAAQGNVDPWASRQLVRFGGFFPIMIALALIDIRIWYKLSYLVYAAMLCLLVLVEFKGQTIMGATRWIHIGPLTLQPSEMMKLCLVFGLARYFHAISLMNTWRVAYLIAPLIMIVLPAVLILRQPDLGTTAILLATGVMVLFATGVRIWIFVGMGIFTAIGIPAMWFSGLIHQYQKDRVIAFLNPGDDPLTTGYNVLQSKIAIGSGGFSGKGFLKGTQSQLSFLPEKQTDFIFTMLVEEFGFIGGVAVIVMYGIVLACGTFIAMSSSNHYGRVMAIGITSILFLHVFVNIAMVMGVIPIVGAPLPLLSYGGTFMITIMACFGMLLNVHVHNQYELNQNYQRYY